MKLRGHEHPWYPARAQDDFAGRIQINNDIAVAADFTLAAKQMNADKLNDVISSPIGAKFEARPGL